MGGAGCGKSITAANIRSQLGFKGMNIELVDEVIKDWTYVPRSPESSDSYYLQACQIQKEDLRLRAGVDLIVSDSPLMLQYFYANWHKHLLQEAMLSAALEFEEVYPSIHIIIERNDNFYNSVGRFETLEEAQVIDRAIKKMLRMHNIQFSVFSCVEQDELIEYLVKQITLEGQDE